MKTTIKIWFSLSLIGFFVSSFSWASSTGLFLESISTQKDVVLSQYDTSYNRIYSQFQISGASIMNSLDYKALVCLGVMKNAEFLNQLQADLKALKVDFLNQYSIILSSVSDLDQKQRIYNDSHVSLFTWGSYDKDLAVLSGQYANLITLNQQKIVSFQQSYFQKLSAFIADFTTYSKKNKIILTQIGSKLALLQTADDRFDALTAFLNGYRVRISGSGSAFFDTLPILRASSIAALDTSLQKIADTQIKMQRILPDLSGSLIPQKFIVLSGYINQFDLSYNQFLALWYDNATYLSLQNRLSTLHATYLSGSAQCSNLIMGSGFDITVATILKDLTTLSGSLQTGIVVSSGFESKAMTWFSSLKAKQTDALSTYKTYVQSTTQAMLTAYRAAHASVETPTWTELSGNQAPVVTAPVVEIPSVTPIFSWSVFVGPIGFTFTKPFKTNQKHPDVLVLQKLLQLLSYYTWSLNSIYTKDTLAAVYHFQLDRGLLRGYEKRPQTWGWMWPSTRSALNNLLQ